MYAHYDVNDKNKWVNHRIHRKYNNTQRASKRCGSSRVGKNCQRSGKAVMKQMERDYNDFVFPSRRHQQNIQMMYNQYYNDTMSYFDEHEPSNGRQRGHGAAHPEQCIDGVLVSIDFYQFREEQTEYDLFQIAEQQKKQRERQQRRQERQRQRAEANRRRYGNDWYWSNYTPATQQQEADELQRAIAASLEQEYLIPNYEDLQREEGEEKEEHKQLEQEDEDEEEEEEQPVLEKVYVMKQINNVTVSISVWGHNAKKYFPTYVTTQNAKNELHTVIANKAWNTYRNNALCRINFREHHLWRNAEWKLLENSDRAQATKLNLMHVLDACAPYLYPVYHVLFEYIGYSSLSVNNVKVKLMIADARSGLISCGGNSGIDYVHSLPYDERRRYDDYTDDIKSYIPTYIYYKRNRKNQFCNFGEYDKHDWKLLNYYASKRR